VPPPNTQTTTFVVGQLYIHAFSSDEAGITDMWRFTGVTGIANRVFTRIWPVEDQFVAWPTEDMWDQTADRIAGFIFQQLHLIGRTFGH
jgi:hypothetical protein